jgi:hypothetical protein
LERIHTDEDEGEYKVVSEAPDEVLGVDPIIEGDSVTERFVRGGLGG